MTVALTQHPAEDLGDEVRPNPVRQRWWFFPVVAVGILGTMIVLAIAVLVFRMWHAHRLASRAVAAEVARIQAAGEPITTEDLYAFHRVPAGTRDITQQWLDALASFDENQIFAAATALPIVGLERDASVLRPDSANSQFEAAELFLQDKEPVLQKLHAAAQLPGECRFPVQFEKGVHALLPHAQKMRSAARLLQLEARVRAHGGDTDGALVSIADLIAAGQTLEHQPLLIEQLVRIACLTIAFQEIEFLLSETQLTGEQLAALQQRLASIDLQGGLTAGLVGERGMTYHAFHHLSEISQETGGIDLGGAEGELARPADCQKSLELLGEMIEASRQPFPAARQRAEQVENRLKKIVGSRNPLDKLTYMMTALLMPATGAAVDGSARAIARRDALLAAIAAERYRLDTGSFPTQLADLMPQYLPAVPTDPFDGKPLRMLAGPGEQLFYSVGKDQIDDRGVENQQAGEPDIAIRIPAASQRGQPR